MVEISLTMKQLPFDLVHLEVSKLFNAAVSDVSDVTFATKVVDERTDRIRSFIEACGWEVEEYVSRTFRMGPADNELN